jgi:hypothetical protein
MVDAFAILLTHGLMLLAAWHMLSRDDLDREDGEERPAMRRSRDK